MMKKFDSRAETYLQSGPQALDRTDAAAIHSASRADRAVIHALPTMMAGVPVCIFCCGRGLATAPRMSNLIKYLKKSRYGFFEIMNVSLLQTTLCRE